MACKSDAENAERPASGEADRSSCEGEETRSAEQTKQGLLVLVTDGEGLDGKLLTRLQGDEAGAFLGGVGGDEIIALCLEVALIGLVQVVA